VGVPFSGYDIGITAVSIMIAVSGIILGIGYSLSDRKLKQLGMSELYQALISAALLGSLILMFGPSGLFTSIINSLSSGVQPQSCQGYFYGNSALCFSYSYLIGGLTVQISNNTQPSLIASTTGMLAAASGLYMVIGTLASVKMDVGIISVGLQGLAVFLGPLKGITEFLAFAILSIIAQAAILRFISVASITVLLPLGLVLRVFYFTRRLGGTIIAITIGLFAVLPLTYVLGAILLNSFSGYAQSQMFDSATSALNSSSSSSSSTGGLVQEAVSTLSSGNSISSASGLTSLLRGASAVLSSLVNEVGDALAFLVLQVFLLPTFDLILTIVSIRELARILGSEVSLGRFDIF
jgi:hypothetical protein